jgi:hypothetical protein
MNTIKILATALIVAGMLTTPLMARERCMADRHAERAYTNDSLTSRCIDGRLWIPAPVAPSNAAPSSQPGGICDWGDNPMVC